MLQIEKKIEFKPVTLLDKQLFDEFYKSNDKINSVNDFATIFCWNVTGNTKYALIDNDVLIISTIYMGKKAYYFPISKSKRSLRPYIEMILDIEDYNGHFIAHIEKEDLDGLQDIKGYKLIYDRDYSDYIYLSKDLIELKGKQFHGKKNHLNKFVGSYKYIFRDYQSKDFEQCIELYDLWLKNSGTEKTLEREAIIRALQNIEYLGLKCGVIEIDGRIRAFSVISILPNKKAGNVLFEKADIQYEGIFAAINNFCAKEYLKDVVYVNRQEDMGIEGLRKSKLSYHPVFLLNKYRLICDTD
ncbi:MAG TPA: phosphatidylglycerol lysyltransferase domain-containing protein [Clostridia bacterium]